MNKVINFNKLILILILLLSSMAFFVQCRSEQYEKKKYVKPYINKPKPCNCPHWFNRV